VESTLYNFDRGSVQAFDALTGLSRWQIDLDERSCVGSVSLDADSKSIYLLCDLIKEIRSDQAQSSIEGWILKLDAKTGEMLWYERVQREASLTIDVAIFNDSSIFVIADSSDISEIMAWDYRFT